MSLLTISVTQHYKGGILSYRNVYDDKLSACLKPCLWAFIGIKCQFGRFCICPAQIAGSELNAAVISCNGDKYAAIITVPQKR